MAPAPKSTITHFIHPSHPLKLLDLTQEYLCDGCKTLGYGKRYTCNTCDFDLHEYCGTCPVKLTSFMHKKHPLTRVMRKAGAPQVEVDRICDVCTEPVEGLFYQCKACDFEVHPLCTQLPEQLSHALHKAHPLSLESPKSAEAGVCSVCTNLSNSWHYCCKVCNFEIHLECVLVPTGPPCPAAPQTAETTQPGIPRYDQGIPFQPPPQYVPYYYPEFEYSQSYYHEPGQFNPQNMDPQNFTGQNTDTSSSNGRKSRRGKSIFSLIGHLGYEVLSNMDLSSLF